MADGELIAELARAERIAAEENEWSLPVVFQAKGRDGVTDIWGNLYFPASFDPSRRRHYPLIEAIYAGPHDAHVPKRYQHGRRFQELTSLGFVVVQIDGMGTANRSKAFHDRCWQDLKDAGFPDRIAWMRAAAEAYPALDLSRVGVFGTSAGGQNACAALLWHGDLYRAAYAACGCHDNRMDKASWNEQWMGYPVGPHYAASSNIEHARRLRGQLFLVVGELDRNVPPESTYRLVDALIDADKDFEFLMVPGMGHSDGGVYGRRRMREFFVDAFAPPASPIKPASSPKDR
jgi:dipeptidyl aminopeptidase/acylaminoacyl peptidase